MDERLPPAAVGVDPGFESALAESGKIDGWLRPEQARVLWAAAAHAGPGARIVEIGSYRGRSTVVLARAMPESAELIAIDPHAGTDTAPRWSKLFAEDGDADHRQFWTNLTRAGVAHRIRHIRARSADALNAVEGPIDVLYIDGAHQYRNVIADLDRWSGRLRSGGTLLVHDAFNSVGVTLALMRRMLWTGRFRYGGRCRSLAEYRYERVAGADRLGNMARQLASLPWFIHNVVIKMLRSVGLARFGRLLGDRGDGTY
jgi:predicted O-methyltransferase YrrM